MKKNVIITGIFIILFFSNSLGTNELFEKNNIDIKWGDSKEDIQKTYTLNEIHRKDEVAVYSVDINQIANIEINKLTLSFYRNNLNSVSIYLDGNENFKRFKKLIESIYGAGYQSNKNIEEYSWSKIGDNIFKEYEYNRISEQAVFSASVKGKNTDEYGENKIVHDVRKTTNYNTTIDDEITISESVRKEFVSIFKEELIKQGFEVNIQTKGTEGKIFYINWPYDNNVIITSLFTDEPKKSLIDMGFEEIVICNNLNNETKYNLIEKRSDAPYKNIIGTASSDSVVIQRSYVFNSLYSIVPGEEIARINHLVIYEELNYIHVEQKFMYVGRSNNNVIKVRYIHNIEASRIIVTDEDNTLELYIENPNTSTIITMGGTVDEPTLKMSIYLKGSNLYYKVISDYISEGNNKKN